MSIKYIVVNELTSEQLDQLHILMQQMWWCKDRTKDDIVTMLKHCIPFALLDTLTQRLVGFARVLTDEIRYAYIYDVIVEEHLRDDGLGKLIMKSILHDPAFARVKYFELTCTPEITGYYEKFGFSSDYHTVVAMRYTNGYK